MLRSSHQDFLDRYAISGQHYDYDTAPIAYMNNNKNKLSPETLQHALNSDNDEVRRTAIVMNDVDENVLRKEINHPSFIVRNGVVTHPNVPLDVLEKAAKDPHKFVRVAALANPKSTREMVSHAAENDSNPYVKETAQTIMFRRGW